MSRVEELARLGVVAKEHPLYEAERARRWLLGRTATASVGVFLCGFLTFVAAYIPFAAIIYLFFTPSVHDADWIRLGTFAAALAVPVFCQTRWLRRLRTAFDRLNELELLVPATSDVRQMVLEPRRGYAGPPLLRAGREPTHDLLRAPGPGSTPPHRLLRTGPPR